MSVVKLLASTALLGAAGMSTPALALDQLDQYVGEVRAFALPHCPHGWLETTGEALSAGQYRELFAVIGHRYGGTGQTFNAPDNRLMPSHNGPAMRECIAYAGYFPRPVNGQ